jgi:hypothetical protein
MFYPKKPIVEDELAEQWAETSKMIRKAIKQRCEFEQDWALSNKQRYWLTFKVWVCLILNLYLERAFTFDDDHVTVAILDGGTYPCEWGTCGWEEVLIVGKGFLHNWWFTVEHDGWP